MVVDSPRCVITTTERYQERIDFERRRYDVVVFADADQLRLADAIAVMAYTGRAVFVGDPACPLGGHTNEYHDNLVDGVISVNNLHRFYFDPMLAVPGVAVEDLALEVQPGLVVILIVARVPRRVRGAAPAVVLIRVLLITAQVSWIELLEVAAALDGLLHAWPFIRVMEILVAEGCLLHAIRLVRPDVIGRAGG